MKCDFDIVKSCHDHQFRLPSFDIVKEMSRSFVNFMFYRYFICHCYYQDERNFVSYTLSLMLFSCSKLTHLPNTLKQHSQRRRSVLKRGRGMGEGGSS